MLHCWDADPQSRPDFTQLVTQLGDFLETGVRQVTVAVAVSLTNRYVKVTYDLKNLLLTTGQWHH